MSVDGPVVERVRLREHARTFGSALLVVFLAFFCALAFAGVTERALLAAGFAGDDVVVTIAVNVLQLLGFGVGIGGYVYVSDHEVPALAHARTLGNALLVIFLAFLAALIAASLGGVALAAAGYPQDGMVFRVGATVLQFIGFGVGVAGYLLVTKQPDLVRAHLPTRTDLVWVVVGFVALFTGAVAISAVLAQLGVQVAQNQVVVTGQDNPRFFLYMIPVSLLFVGPFEELVFRGVVQGLFRRRYGSAVAIGAAATLFGVAHLVALTGGGSRVSYLAVAAILGLVLGFTYERTENLAVPALVHGGYNALLFTGQYAAATGLVG
jgi:membrane protease YdiL (CAAX protease family)